MSGLCTFRKSENEDESVSTIKIGDWVTQYSAGYWMVVSIFPKFADEDYNYEGKSWKKGDRLGEWVILKKGFTAKMKPGNACEFVDAKWCKLVSDDIKESIERAFSENPKAKAKFDHAPNMPRPSVASVWMSLTDDQEGAFLEHIKTLPDRFTLEQFWILSANYEKYIADPANATHILYLFSYLWEINGSFEPLHFAPEIKKL